MDLYVFAINVTSYPKQSRVDWFKGNNLIDRNDTRFAQGDVNIPSLTLIKANRKDTGNYSVNVTNNVTKQFVHDCHTNLIVQCKFQIVFSCSVFNDNVLRPAFHS